MHKLAVIVVVLISIYTSSASFFRSLRSDSNTLLQCGTKSGGSFDLCLCLFFFFDFRFVVSFCRLFQLFVLFLLYFFFCLSFFSFLCILFFVSFSGIYQEVQIRNSRPLCWSWPCWSFLGCYIEQLSFLHCSLPGYYSNLAHTGQSAA